jgi:hypothetical protein
MSQAPEKQWFPLWLMYLLLGPMLLFAIGHVLLFGFRNPLAWYFWYVALAIEAVAVPIALFYRRRPEYRTEGNFIITLFAAAPLATAAVFFVWILAASRLHIGHFHI